MGKILLEQEEDYCEPVRVGNSRNNKYIEYESKGERNKNLPMKGYLDKIKAYLKDIIKQTYVENSLNNSN